MPPPPKKNELSQDLGGNFKFLGGFPTGIFVCFVQNVDVYIESCLTGIMFNNYNWIIK